MNKTARIMADMKYAGPLTTIERLQAHSARLEADYPEDRSESMLGLVLIGVAIGIGWFLAGLGVGFLMWGLQ